MKSPIFGYTAIAASVSAVNYIPMMGAGASGPNSTETSRQMVAPASFTLSTFYVGIDTAPGGSTSYNFKVRKNGVDQALQCGPILGAAMSAVDNVDTVSVAAGDILDISITPASTPATFGKLFWNLVADSGVSHYCGLWGAAATTTNLSTSVVSYSQLTGSSNGSSSWSATEATQQIICPTGGTISDLYTATDIAPGAGTSYAFTLVKNGSATALSATTSGAVKTANDTTHSVSVVAGDTLSISATPASTPLAGRYSWGLKFTPSIPGESFFGFGSSNAPSTTLTQFELPLGVGGNGFSSTETLRQLMLGTVVVTAFYVSLGTAPGSGKSRTATIRQNATNSTAAVTISNTNTTGSITGQSISVGQTDLISLQLSEASTPAADTNGVHVGVLTYIAVPSSGSHGFFALMS